MTALRLARVVGPCPRQQQTEGEGATILKRQRFNLLLRDNPRHFGLRRLHNRRLARDRDRFLNAGNAHGEVLGIFEADGERDVLDFLGCKARQLGLHVIAARWNAADTVPPVFFRHSRPDDPAFCIRHCNSHTRQNAALLIGDDTGDNGVGDLRQGRHD